MCYDPPWFSTGKKGGRWTGVSSFLRVRRYARRPAVIVQLAGPPPSRLLISQLCNWEIGHCSRIQTILQLCNCGIGTRALSCRGREAGMAPPSRVPRGGWGPGAGQSGNGRVPGGLLLLLGNAGHHDCGGAGAPQSTGLSQLGNYAIGKLKGRSREGCGTSRGPVPQQTREVGLTLRLSARRPRSR